MTEPPAVLPQQLEHSIAEDAAAATGESIDTFSLYRTTALPRCVDLVILSGKSSSCEKEESEGKKDLVACLVPSCSENAIYNGGVGVDRGKINGIPSTLGSRKHGDVENGPEESQAGDGGKKQENANRGMHEDYTLHTTPACESALLASVSAPRAPDQSVECLMELVQNKVRGHLQSLRRSIISHRRTRSLTLW